MFRAPPSLRRHPDDRSSTSRVARLQQPLLLVVATVVFVGLGVRWMYEFRSPPLLDIDEAGYLVFALQNYGGWTAGGIDGWWDSVLAPSIQAPLLTATTTPFFAALGGGALVGLLVPLMYVALTLVATWWLAREAGSVATAWLAWTLCAAAPVLVVYSRHYSFGSAAAATTTLALAALTRSRGLTSTRWALVTGLCIGFISLSRTVMLAMIPGIVLAMLVVALAGPQVRRRLINLVLAGIVASLVAAPWYLTNGAAVLDYLTSFGYGPRAGEYGSDESVLSTGSWLRMAQYAVSELGVVLSLLLMCGAVLLAVALVRRDGADEHGSARLSGVVRRTIASPLLPPVVFLGWSTLLLTSTGNKGTGFVAPLVPVACVLAAAGIVRARLVVRRTLAAAAVCSLALTTAAHADARTELADRHTVDLPVLGESLLVDGAGRTDAIVRGARPSTREETPAMPPAVQRTWIRATERLALELDGLGATSVPTVFGFRHHLVHANGVQFAQMSSGRAQLPLNQISPPDAIDVETAQAWLASSGACLLVTAPGASLEIEPAIDQGTVIGAAKAAGFTRAARWGLPNGRPVVVWRGPAC